MPPKINDMLTFLFFISNTNNSIFYSLNTVLNTIPTQFLNEKLKANMRSGFLTCHAFVALQVYPSGIHLILFSINVINAVCLKNDLLSQEN